MGMYTTNATLPIKMANDSMIGNTTPIDDVIPTTKVRFIESSSLTMAEQESNKFMDGKYVISLDIIPSGINYIVKILYF